jgi:hypothetical protein
VSETPDSHPNGSGGTSRGGRRRFRRRPTQRRGGHAGRTPTASHVDQPEPSPSGCPPTGPLARLLDTTADARPPQRSHCRWPLCGTCVGHPLSAAGGPVAVHRRTDQRTWPSRPRQKDPRGSAQAAVLAPVAGHLTAAGPTLPGHPVRPQDDLAAHRTGRRKQRTVNPPVGHSLSTTARSDLLQLPLLFLKAGPAGGRLRRPSSAGSTSTGPEPTLSP